MMARLWTDGTRANAGSFVVEVLIDAIDLSHQLPDVVEEELRLRQQLAFETAREDCRDRQRGAMRSEDVVGRVADGERVACLGAELFERRLKNLRRRLGKFGIVLRRRAFHKVADAEKRRIVLHLILVRRRSERELDSAPVQRLEVLTHARKRLYILQVLVLVKFAPIFLQLLAERAHLARVEQIGNEQIAPFPDL